MKCQTVAQRHNENDQDFVYDNLSRLRAISTRGISTEHFHIRSNFLTISQTFMRRVVARVAVLQKHFPESGRQISFSWRRQSSSEALHREPGNNDPQVFACYVLLVRCDRSRSGWQISGQSINFRSHPIFFCFCISDIFCTSACGRTSWRHLPRGPASGFRTLCHCILRPHEQKLPFVCASAPSPLLWVICADAPDVLWTFWGNFSCVLLRSHYFGAAVR